MNILMFTNSFGPFVGGVPRSVRQTADCLRWHGHRVLIIAPAHDGAPHEHDVLRVPVFWQPAKATDIPLRLPIPGLLTRAINDLAPDLVHSHHPFLLGDAALFVASNRGIPLVFTHHTHYEHYTHYLLQDGHGPDSPLDGSQDALGATVQRLASELTLHYAELCDGVIAPSRSTAELLRFRGLQARMEVIPSGVDLAAFRRGNRDRFRRRLGLGEHHFILGHVGRLGMEKNPQLLAQVLALTLTSDPRACALVIGSGQASSILVDACCRCGVQQRLHLPGTLQGTELADAYHAMDAFVFTSQSETQGMVLTEAAAAGVPILALDAPGARELLQDGKAGTLVSEPVPEQFLAVLQRWRERPELRRRLGLGAWHRARAYSLPRCTLKLLAFYQQVLDAPQPRSSHSLLRREWRLWSDRCSLAARWLKYALAT